MTPRVSVVIPTHGRATRLAFALDSLTDQTLSPDEFEVIVVRGPSSTDEPAPESGGANVRILESAELGPAPQRNVGWSAARAPRVAFMDDDCRVAPDWLESHLEAVAGASKADCVVQGRTSPDPDELHLLYGLARSIEITEASGLYETCNISYPRSLLERLGGFDEGFRLPHWGEDTDLGLRAEESGAALIFAPRAIAWHAVHPNWLPVAIREAGRRRRFARLVARHPRLRSSLYVGVFANRSHASIAFAAAGAIAAIALPRRRRGLAAVTTAPYVLRALTGFVQSGNPTPRAAARFVTHLPARAAVDIAETAATVRGAIEERTFLI